MDQNLKSRWFVIWPFMWYAFFLLTLVINRLFAFCDSFHYAGIHFTTDFFGEKTAATVKAKRKGESMRDVWRTGAIRALRQSHKTKWKTRRHDTVYRFPLYLYVFLFENICSSLFFFILTSLLFHIVGYADNWHCIVDDQSFALSNPINKERDEEGEK